MRAWNYMSRYYFTNFLSCCTACINRCFYSAYITANHYSYKTGTNFFSTF